MEGRTKAWAAVSRATPRDGLSVGPAHSPDPGPVRETCAVRSGPESNCGALGGPVLPLLGTDPGGEAGGYQPGQRLPAGY